MTDNVIRFPRRRQASSPAPRPSLGPELAVDLVLDLVRRGRVGRALAFAERLPASLAQQVEAALTQLPRTRP